MSEVVIGTAGHIDHGKTSLVKLLTGRSLDSLPEEQARGITIALGFASLELDTGTVALVDVPGHERLVRTMIAGATGLDAVMLCVSALDGVMPQTREHLDILELLGVRQGLIVLTMCDLVDDEEMLELAEEDARDAVAGTFLEGAAVIRTSATEGTGRDALVDALRHFTRTERDPEGPFRLPVDRAFVRQGFGTVVTGTTWSGVARVGDGVRLLPSGVETRVRGIQVHGEAGDVAMPGTRTALNLSGVEAADVPRGTVVTKGEVPCPQMIDVKLRVLRTAPALEDGSSVRLLLGTAEIIGNVHFAAGEGLEPGRSGFAQLRLASPMPCVRGDRFILRRTSPVTTVGGGEVVDPYAPKLRRKAAASFAPQLERLRGGDLSVWLERAGEHGLPESEWRRRGGSAEVGVCLGDARLAARVLARLQGVLIQALAQYHVEEPLSLGAHRRELRRGRLGHLDEKVFDALVDGLAETRQVEVSGALVRVTGFEVRLTASQESLKSALIGTIAAQGLEGIAVKALHAAHPDEEVAALMKLIEREGTCVQVAGLGWVAAAALTGLRDAVRRWFAEHAVLQPTDFKEQTGLTRKSAIPLLEWLDKQGLTQRSAEGRVAGPRAR